MSSTPEDFLNFAIEAFGSGEASEFTHRNVASRAYYSAFHCCRAERHRCPDLDDGQIQGSHDKLYNKFAALPGDEVSLILKRMAYMAKMMKSVRHEADYWLDQDFGAGEAKQQISDAKKVLAQWNTLKTTS